MMKKMFRLVKKKRNNLVNINFKHQNLSLKIKMICFIGMKDFSKAHQIREEKSNIFSIKC